MKLFIFKIHENCSHRDGMAVVVAETPEEACNYLKAVKDAEIWPDVGGDDLLIDDDDVVSLARNEGKYPYDHSEWYLAKTYKLADWEYDDAKGVRLVAYHDG